MWIDIEYIKVNERQFKKLDKNKIENHFCIAGNGRHRYYGAKAAGIKWIEVNILNESK